MMAIKSCPLELKDVHPEHVDDNVKGLISDIMRPVISNAELLVVLNERLNSCATDQVVSIGSYILSNLL